MSSIPSERTNPPAQDKAKQRLNRYEIPSSSFIRNQQLVSIIEGEQTHWNLRKLIPIWCILLL